MVSPLNPKPCPKYTRQAVKEIVKWYGWKKVSFHPGGCVFSYGEWGNSGRCMNQAAPATIIIIGADAHFCYLIKRYLKRGAHHSSLVNIGDNVLEKVTILQPAAIILEIGKPGTAGWQVLGKLKTFDKTRHIPVIVLTWQENHDELQLAGANLTLRMPILYEDFALALKHVGFKVV